MNFRPMNDVAFHFVFGRESRKYNLLNLLNAILTKADNELITELRLQETTLDADTVGLKSCRLDIRAVTSKNHHINIEVQILNQGNIEKRSLYYWSRLFTAQLGEGQDYGELNKTIAINILDFSRFQTDRVHSIYRILEASTGIGLSDVFEIHFLELPHLNMGSADLDCPLTRWMLFLSDETDEKLKEAILMQDKDIRKAYKDLEGLAADKDIKRYYEIREDAARDYRSGIKNAREEGRTEGREEGREEGRQEKIRLVKKMLEIGLDEDLIKETAELTQAELDVIKRS